MCKEMFHGVPPGGVSAKQSAATAAAAPPDAPPELSLQRRASSSSTPDRLYCSGAASITSAWKSFLNSKTPLASASLVTKHHVDTSGFPAAMVKLERMATSEYRLKCRMCESDVVGLRFSCIHCPGGLDLCGTCAVKDRVPHVGGLQAHAFQVFSEDLHPPMKPQARCGICFEEDDVLDDPDVGRIIWLESCRHTFHEGCLKRQLSNKWTGKKISFGYLNCGECRKQLEDELLVDSMKEHLKLKERVEKMCVEKCVEDEVVPELPAMLAAGDLKGASEVAMGKLTVLQCSSCNEPFCGGRVDCAADESLDITRIRCAPCAFEIQEQAAAEARRKALEAAAAAGDKEAIRMLTTGWKGACKKHGYKNAIYKCDSCCAVAVFDCRTNRK